MNEFRPTPKPSFGRRKLKRGDVTKISSKVRREVLNRSNGLCERCGVHRTWGMQMAHLISAAQGGSGKEPWNIALLCGPSTNSGTCHHFADHTAAGREWRKQLRKRLEAYYEVKGK